MRVYLFSPERLYTGLSLDHAGAVPPYNATDVPPPDGKPGFFRRFDPAAGAWALVPRDELPRPPAFPQPTPEEMLAGARAAKLAEINAACQAALAALTPTYPERELLTFDKQEAEARTYQADSGASVPLLTALAASRGISVADLAARVIAKADTFTAASGHLIGQRQRLEDALEACETVDAVLAIRVSYGLPEEV